MAQAGNSLTRVLQNSDNREGTRIIKEIRTDEPTLTAVFGDFQKYVLFGFSQRSFIIENLFYRCGIVTQEE